MQNIDIVVGDEIERVTLPDPSDQWADGLAWGDASFLLTPAWIAKHAHMRWRLGMYDEILGGGRWSLAEEVVFCLLSGFGIRAETAEAALLHLQDAGLFRHRLSRDRIEALLREPLVMAGGRRCRYRFPAKRADYVHGALERLGRLQGATGDLALRDTLLTIRGIGPKTASFIVRNFLGSNNVAVLDIHVLRACVIARIFPHDFDLTRDYARLEQRFLAFAQAASVPASVLDATIWQMTREIDPREMQAADRFNRCLKFSEGLPVACFDPYATLPADLLILGRGDSGGRKQEEILIGI